MKNIKITIGALLLMMAFNFSMAQSVSEKATAQTEKMDSELGLASDQKARIAELNFGIMDKNEAILNDPKMSEEVKKQSIQGNNDSRLEILRGILSPEQYEAYKKSETKVEPMRRSARLDFSKLAPQTVAQPATEE